uniref:Uncharacterized protein n=1 Tax=Arion vulgaris TaxID=1028688 RepID=A0A0B7A761_9EUPU
MCRWLEYQRRVDNSRIPQQVLFCQLSEGNRPQGRLLLRYKDVCKSSMKNFSVSTNK